MKIDAGAPTAAAPQTTFAHTPAPATEPVGDRFEAPKAAASPTPAVVTKQAVGMVDGWVTGAESRVGRVRSWVVDWADAVTRRVVDLHNQIVALADVFSARAVAMLERLRAFVDGFARRNR